MKRFVFLAVCLVVATAFVTGGGKSEKTSAGTTAPQQAVAGAVVLKLAHADPTDIYTSRKHAQCVAFANMVNSRSGGKLAVQVYGSGALGGEREYVEAIRAGTVEAGIASGVMGNFFPAAMVTDIPYLFPTAEVAWEVMDGPFGQKLAKKLLNDTGLRCLSFAEVGFRNFTNSSRPIKTPADMKGLKIRVMETPLYVTMMKALGANPTPIAWTETYTALQTNVVNGQENPVPTILMAKLYEVQKYLTLDGHVYGVDWFIINNKFFKDLSPELQYIVLDSAKISSGVGRGVQQMISVMGIQSLQEQKMEIYSPTEQELDQFREATQKPVIEWLKTKVDAAIIDEVLQEVKRVIAKEKAELQ